MKIGRKMSLRGPEASALAAVLAVGLVAVRGARRPGGRRRSAAGGGAVRFTARMSSAEASRCSGPVVVTVSGRQVQEPTRRETTRSSGLPGGKHAIVAELKTAEIRYLALPFAFVDEQQALQLDIVLTDAGDVDRFCSECHPFSGKQTRSGQIVRDMHPSGIKPRKAIRTTQLLDAQGLVTCESCHSLHQETGVERFVLYPFKNGDLCNRCH